MWEEVMTEKISWWAVSVCLYTIMFVATWGYFIAWAWVKNTDALVAAVLLGWFPAMVWPIPLAAFFWLNFWF
jgi:hypothetical protein